jgi:hypothetical protein
VWSLECQKKKKNQQHHMIKSDAWAMGIQVDSATGTGMVAMAVLQGRGGWMRKRASLQ